MPLQQPLGELPRRGRPGQGRIEVDPVEGEGMQAGEFLDVAGVDVEPPIRIGKGGELGVALEELHDQPAQLAVVAQQPGRGLRDGVQGP